MPKPCTTVFTINTRCVDLSDWGGDRLVDQPAVPPVYYLVPHFGKILQTFVIFLLPLSVNLVGSLVGLVKGSALQGMDPPLHQFPEHSDGNATFSAQDFKNLASIGQGSKLEKLGKTGRFGLGCVGAHVSANADQVLASLSLSSGSIKRLNL